METNGEIKPAGRVQPSLGALLQKEDSEQWVENGYDSKMVEKAQEEEAKRWAMLTFEGSPAKKNEWRETYCVKTQRRKAAHRNTPRKERKGEHPLELIGVFEVVPNTPPPKARAQSAEPYRHTQRITVHASDFIKYGNDIEKLKTLKVEPPSFSKPVADQVCNEDLQKSAGDGKQPRSRRTSDAGIPHSQEPKRYGSPYRPSSRLASRPTSARARKCCLINTTLAASKRVERLAMLAF